MEDCFHLFVYSAILYTGWSHDISESVGYEKNKKQLITTGLLIGLSGKVSQQTALAIIKSS